MKTAILLLSFCPMIGFGQIVDTVVPGALERNVGNTGSLAPFDVGSETIRYQQVYDASEFSELGNSAWLLTDILFRVDESEGSGGYAFNSILPSVQINLSTTSKKPDGLSSVFAENTGVNETVVFDKGPLPLRSFGWGGASIWEVHIPLMRPFLYEPSKGNLLLDVWNFGGGDTGLLDAQRTSGDSISSLLSYYPVDRGGVDSLTGVADTFGVLTRFLFEPVPEPSSMALLALGGLAGAVAVWRRKTR